MFGSYYDSFDCEITPEELEGFEDWYKELDENEYDDWYKGIDEYEYPLINEENIPF